MATNLKVYVPDKKFIVGVLIVLVGTTAALKYFGTNAYVAKAKGWLGLSV